MKLEWMKVGLREVAIVKKQGKVYSADIMPCNKEPCPDCTFLKSVRLAKDGTPVINCKVPT